MIDELDLDHVRWFIRNLHGKYEEQSRIREWCNIEPYLEWDPQQAARNSFRRHLDEPEEETRFIQIGNWTKLPISIIQRPQLSLHNINSFVRQITLGERNYLLSQLDEESADGNIRFITSDGFSIEEFEILTNQVNHPAYLILPLHDELRDMRRNWRQSSNYHFKRKEIVVANGVAIEVYWYPPEKDEDLEGNGYLIGADAINIIQKWQGDSEDPNAFERDEDYDVFSQNRPFMVYLGKEIVTVEDEEAESLRERIDFLYRTVVSEPDIDPAGVLQFRF